MIELASSRFAEGLHFGEGPRFHEGALWCSDMHGNRVLRFAADGQAEVITEVSEDPSGLGWLPGGDLLIVSMRDRRLLRWDGTKLAPYADLSDLASGICNDMVVDGHGRAYVGNFGFDFHAGAKPQPAELILVEPDGTARVVAEDMQFPNGTVITPEGDTLIVGESFAGRLTAFDIDADGSLANRRVWAALPEGAVPDGICLDAAGGIWVASPTTNEALRVLEGGEVTHRVGFDQGAFACALSETTLFTLTCDSSHPEACRQQATGRVEQTPAPYPAAGWP